jgi:uncharacterized protein DUF4386
MGTAIGHTGSQDAAGGHAQQAYARLAGLMYLTVIGSFIADIWIESVVKGGGGFLDTAHRIQVSEGLYRIGLLSGLFGTVATVLLAVGLYVTVRPVDPNLALTALLFRIVEVATGSFNAISAFATVQLYLAANHSNTLDANQLAALVDLTSSTSGTYVAAIFFCVGSTIFFYLFLRSGYIPKILAGWGVFASVLYLFVFAVSLIAPQAAGILTAIGTIPILIAEVSTGLWLLFRGIRTA